MFPVRKVYGSSLTRGLHWILAHCSPSSEWAPGGNTGGDKGGEERNWPPYLTCRWLRISVLSNRHSPTYEIIRGQPLHIPYCLLERVLVLGNRLSKSNASFLATCISPWGPPFIAAWKLNGHWSTTPSLPVAQESPNCCPWPVSGPWQHSIRSSDCAWMCFLSENDTLLGVVTKMLASWCY